MGDGPAKIQYPQTLNYTIPDPSVKICAKLTEYQGEAGVIDYCRVDSDKKINEVGVTLPDPLKFKKDDEKLKGIKGVIDYNTRLYWTLGGSPELAGIYEQVQNVPTSQLQDKCTGQNWNDLITNMNAARLAKKQSSLSIPSDAVQGLQTFCMDRGYEALQSSSRSSFQQGVLAMHGWLRAGEQEEQVAKESTKKKQNDYVSVMGDVSKISSVSMQADINLGRTPIVQEGSGWYGTFSDNMTMITKERFVTMDLGDGSGEQTFLVTERIFELADSEYFGDDDQAAFVFSKIALTFINGICVSIKGEIPNDAAQTRDGIVTNSGKKVNVIEVLDPKYSDLKVYTGVRDWFWGAATGTDGLASDSSIDTKKFGTETNLDRKILLTTAQGLMNLTYHGITTDAEKGAGWSGQQKELLSRESANLSALINSWDSVSSDRSRMGAPQTPINEDFKRPPHDRVGDILSYNPKSAPQTTQQTSSGAAPAGGQQISEQELSQMRKELGLSPTQDSENTQPLQASNGQIIGYTTPENHQKIMAEQQKAIEDAKADQQRGAN